MKRTFIIIFLIISLSFFLPVYGYTAEENNEHKHSGGETCSTCNHETTDEHNHQEGETCPSCNNESHDKTHSEHNHPEGETCPSCEHESHDKIHSEHNHQEGETCPSCEHDHDHENGECGVGHHHDDYILKSVTEQPWRHPERVGNDIWLKKIAPLCIIFILAIMLKPGINKLIKKVGI